MFTVSINKRKALKNMPNIMTIKTNVHTSNKHNQKCKTIMLINRPLQMGQKQFPYATIALMTENMEQQLLELNVSTLSGPECWLPV